MIELELTYLAKLFPEGLENARSMEIIDIYLPKEERHPTLRIRKLGEKFEITKKYPVKEGDASELHEHTIQLGAEEFGAFAKIDGKRTRKVRYYYNCNGRTAEIGVFKDALEGLVLVDFEFESAEEKQKFMMPDFCLADVTQEEFLAGGMLCGKGYGDIEKGLAKFSYKKLFLR